jgi:hypothetical protein
MESAGAARPLSPLRYGERTQERLVPLALASLVLGSRRPLVGFFKSSSAAFQIEMGEVEAQKIAAHDPILFPSHSGVST